MGAFPPPSLGEAETEGSRLLIAELVQLVAGENAHR